MGERAPKAAFVSSNSRLLFPKRNKAIAARAYACVTKWRNVENAQLTVPADSCGVLALVKGRSELRRRVDCNTLLLWLRV